MVVGGLVAFVVNNASPIPAVVPLWSVIVAILASILTGVGFGMYPAARAAKLDPVEALRYE
jgi:putative ABC transport system permease protein